MTTSKPIISRGRRDGAVLFLGDAANEEDQTYQGIETLIAVGTQAGKVLVFDILGLLLHEVVMNVPIISVEWVGDMSVPSILPNHKPFPSPEPGPAIKSLMTGVGEIEDEERKDATEDKDPPGQPSDSGSPVLVRQPNVSFSNKAQEQTPHSPAGQFPNVLQVSSSLLRRTIQWPKTDIFIRARNGTKTHSSPSTSSTRLFSSRELSDWPDHEKAQIQDARKWAHTRKAPAVTPRRVRRVRASRKSSCCNQ